MTKYAVLLLASLAVAACGGGDERTDTTGAFRLRRQVASTKLPAALRADDDVALVVALDLPAAAAVQLASESGRSPRPLVVAFGDASTDGLRPDALVVRETGAAVALDLALLARAGAQVPKSPIPLGTRIVTPADAAGGGRVHAGPGDFVVQLLRQRNAAALAPAAPKSCPILVLTPPTLREVPTTLSDRIQRVTDELFAAAARYPQVSLFAMASNTEDDHVRKELAQQDYAAVIALIDDADLAPKILAQSGDLPVILIDPQLRDLGTTTVGCSQESLGRAAAEAVRTLQPEGCAFFTAAADKRSPETIALRDALFATLGLQQP